MRLRLSNETSKPVSSKTSKKQNWTARTTFFLVRARTSRHRKKQNWYQTLVLATTVTDKQSGLNTTFGAEMLVYAIHSLQRCNWRGVLCTFREMKITCGAEAKQPRFFLTLTVAFLLFTVLFAPCKPRTVRYEGLGGCFRIAPGRA